MGDEEGTTVIRTVGYRQCIQAKLALPDFGLMIYFYLICYILTTEKHNINTQNWRFPMKGDK